MGKKDLSEKLLEDYSDVFADIMNVLAFQGERLLKPENIIDGPTVSRYKDADAETRENIRDVVKYDRGNVTFALFGLENQSVIDKHMVFRVMGYDYASYLKQINEKSPVIHPVITLVLYFGFKRWDGPRDVLSAVDKNIPYAKYLSKNLLNPKVNIVEVAFLPKEIREQFTSDFRIVADYFCAVREGREKEVRYNKQEIKHVSEILEFFSVFAKDKRFENCKPVLTEQAKKGAVTMCTVMDYAEKQGIEKGRAEGEAKGRAEGEAKGRAEEKAENMKKDRDRVRGMKEKGFDEESIMDLLKITKDYLEELES